MLLLSSVGPGGRPNRHAIARLVPVPANLNGNIYLPATSLPDLTYPDVPLVSPALQPVPQGQSDLRVQEAVEQRHREALVELR